MWGSHDKPRGATEPRANAPTELTEVRAALAESETRSEERRLALESHIQDVGFMRIQLRVRNARVAALEKEVNSLGEALAHRNERFGERKSDAACLKDTIDALTGTVAERDSRIVALEKEVSALGSTLASRKGQTDEANSTVASLKDTVAALTATIAERDSRIAALEKEVGDLGSTFANRKEQIDEVNSTAASLKDTVAALTATVAERDSRIAALGKEVGALGRALTRREQRIGEVNSDAASLKETIAALTATVAERDANIAALKAKQLSQGETVAARQSDFARVIAETEVQRKNLGSLEAALAAANARCAESEAVAIKAVERRNSMEAAIGEQRQRIARIEIELADAVRDRDASLAAEAAVQAKHLEQSARLTTASARVLELEAAALDPGHASSALEEEPSMNRARSPDLEADLHAAEGSTHRLERDRRKRARLEELAKTYDDSGDPSATHEVGLEDAAPLFIRTGESEVVHVLGRKTTIGRTPENDVQIDAQYISRHHAVILAERTHTIIEDLNSTNGVIVNGRRVMRQALKDGDIVLIGKAPFRFAMRHGTERR
jgi:chromosome segregation ATPase